MARSRLQATKVPAVPRFVSRLEAALGGRGVSAIFVFPRAAAASGNLIPLHGAGLLANAGRRGSILGSRAHRQITRGRRMASPSAQAALLGRRGGRGPGRRRPSLTAFGAYSPAAAQASASGQAEALPSSSQKPPPTWSLLREPGVRDELRGRRRWSLDFPAWLDSSELCGHRPRTPGRPTFQERQTWEWGEAPLRAGGSVVRGRRSWAAGSWRPQGQASSRPVAADPPCCLPVSRLRAGRASGAAQACPVPALPVRAGGGGQKVPLAETSHSRRTSHEVSRDSSSQRQDLLASLEDGPHQALGARTRPTHLKGGTASGDPVVALRLARICSTEPVSVLKTLDTNT